jgi:hypothetical protein
MAPKRIAKCLVKECKNNADGFKGLCKSCYYTAYRAVKANETTWEALERRKLALPDSRGAKIKTAMGKLLAGKGA